MPMRRTLLAIVLLCVTCGAAAGQDVAGSVHRIDGITVRGERPVREAGLTRTEIDSTQLAESGTASMAELLTRHTPLFIKTYGQGSMATVSFRGTAPSHTQVEWNGMNINNPMLGQVDFSLLPVWFVDRVELLHGGSSLQAGAGALGGTVVMGSVPRWDRRFYGTVAQSGGSFGTWQTFVAAGGGSRKVQARVRYLYERARNDFRFRNIAVPPFERVRQQNADYEKHGATADLFWNAGRGHMLALSAWYHHADRNLPHLMSFQGKGRRETQTDDELRVVLRWSKYWRKVSTGLSSGYATTGIDYLLANLTDIEWLTNIDSRSTVHSLYNKYRVEWRPSERTALRAVLNADYHRVRTLDRRSAEGYGASRTELGLTLSAHHSFTSVVAGYVLLRGELSDGSAAPLMPSLGVEVAPLRARDRLRLRLNLTRNYHRPTLNDLYWLPGGNPALKPERGYTGDVAADYAQAFGRWTLGVTAAGYVSAIDDWIAWRPSDYRYWTADNIREVLARGAELTAVASYRASAWTVSLRGNYAYTRTTNRNALSASDESMGKQLIYIPMHKGSAMLSAAWRGFYLDYLCTATGERFTTSSNEATRHRLPAYDLHDVTLGRRFGFGTTVGLDVQLRVNNLFGRDYQAILWRAMPGRNFMLTAKLTF